MRFTGRGRSGAAHPAQPEQRRQCPSTADPWPQCAEPRTPPAAWRRIGPWIARCGLLAGRACACRRIRTRPGWRFPKHLKTTLKATQPATRPHRKPHTKPDKRPRTKPDSYRFPQQPFVIKSYFFFLVHSHSQGPPSPSQAGRTPPAPPVPRCSRDRTRPLRDASPGRQKRRLQSAAGGRPTP